jgi:hypothetical protein
MIVKCEMKRYRIDEFESKNGTMILYKRWYVRCDTRAEVRAFVERVKDDETVFFKCFLVE